MTLLLLILAAWVGLSFTLVGLWILCAWWFGYRPARKRRRALVVATELSKSKGRRA